jgi:hypothetical protein
MVASMRFAAIDEDGIAALNDAHEADQVKTLLVATLLDSDAESGSGFSDDQKEVATDFFFFSFSFCKESGFSSAKTSTFLSIAKVLLLL